MTENTNLTARLRPLRVAMLLQSVALWVPVEKLFMDEIGFRPATFAVMAAAYAAVVPLLEIPSGILADRWRRRGVVMLAAVAALVSVLLGALSTGVASYVVSAMVLGVYFAMQSGTVEAIVYDTVLEETGSSEGFERLQGRIQAVNSAALVVSGLLGGWLAQVFSARATYVLTLPFLVGSILMLTRFREPGLHRPKEESRLREHVALTFKAMVRDPRVLPIVIVMGLSGMLLQVLFEFGPLWLLAADAPPALYGPGTAGLLAALGLGGLLAGQLSFDRPVVMPMVVALILASCLTLSVSHHLWTIIVAQALLATLLVAVGILLAGRLHNAIPSTIRAGVGSGVSTLSWLVFVPFALVFGAVNSAWGVQSAGWLIVALALVAAPLLLRSNREPEEQTGSEIVMVWT